MPTLTERERQEKLLLSGVFPRTIASRRASGKRPCQLNLSLRGIAPCYQNVEGGEEFGWRGRGQPLLALFSRHVRTEQPVAELDAARPWVAMPAGESGGVPQIGGEVSPRLGGPPLPQCKLCRVEVPRHERGVEGDRPGERLQRMLRDIATAHRPVYTRFAELVPNFGVVRIQPRRSFERRKETGTMLPPTGLRRILVQGFEQRLRGDQQALPGWQCVVQPAGPQQVHARQRVSGEGAPLSDLSESPPAQTEGAVQLDGPLVRGYGRVGLPLTIEPLSLQEGFERRERARAERRSPHRRNGARPGQLTQETERDRIDEPIHPQRGASQLGLSHRVPRVDVVQRRRQLHRVRAAADEGSEHRQPGSGAPRDLARRRGIGRSPPAA